MGFEEYLEKLAKEKLEVRMLVKSMLTEDFSTEKWGQLCVIPEESWLEGVMAAFKAHTDVPLELPLFIMFHFISIYLLSKKVRLVSKFVNLHPDLWTIILADSGENKTFTKNVISSQFPFPTAAIQDVSSSAKFIDSFSEQIEAHGFASWLQDEIAQKIKKIETTKSMDEVRLYLLSSSEYDKIERANMTKTVTITEPIISILGLNTPESFLKHLSKESLLDGFSQRFVMISTGAKEEGRSIRENAYKYSLMDREKIEKSVKKAFDEMVKVPIHQEYKLGADAEEAYRLGFQELMTTSIELSFFKRIMFRCFKYAMIFHVVLGKRTNVIGKEEMVWAIRVARLHIQDLKTLLNKDTDMAELGLMIGKAKTVKANFHAAVKNKDKSFTSREVQQGVRGLNAKSARALFELI